MKKSTIFSALLALFLSQVIFSCNQSNIESPTPVISQSEMLVNTLKFTGDMDSEVKVFEKFISLASKEVGKAKALDFASQNYQKYLKNNGIEINTTKSNLRVSAAFQDLIEKMQGELRGLNEGDKDKAKQILSNYNNLVQNGTYSNEEKATLKLMHDNFESSYNLALTVMGNSNGKILFCWKRFWCVLAYGAGNGIVNGLAGMVLCGPPCAGGGFVGGVIVGVYNGLTVYCPSC